MDGVPIPADWPGPRVNGKFRTTAAVETARSLIRPALGASLDDHISLSLPI